MTDELTVAYKMSNGGVLVYTQGQVVEISKPQQPERFVYFIRNCDTKSVKIGVAYHPVTRLKELRTASPSPLLLAAVISGGHKKEAELHKRFAHLRLTGEWFDMGDEGELYDLVSDLINVGCLHQLDREQRESELKRGF